MSEKVLDLLDEMVIKPDQVTLALVFNACGQLANDRAMRIGQKLLDQMPNSFRNHNVVLNSALHMLMKFGDVKRAEHLFEMVKKDIVTYGAMIKGNLL
jgi:lipopolysaccharide biosynthesis regulator YciM